MRKIINRKMYDTETAEFLGGFSNGCDCSDFRYFCEGLYRKKTGELFLYIVGGKLPSCLIYYEDGSSNGNGKIEPISPEQAEDWVLNNCSADLYEKLFGEVEE